MTPKALRRIPVGGGGSRRRCAERRRGAARKGGLPGWGEGQAGPVQARRRQDELDHGDRDLPGHSRVRDEARASSRRAVRAYPARGGARGARWPVPAGVPRGDAPNSGGTGGGTSGGLPLEGPRGTPRHSAVSAGSAPAYLARRGRSGPCGAGQRLAPGPPRGAGERWRRWPPARLGARQGQIGRGSCRQQQCL